MGPWREPFQCLYRRQFSKDNAAERARQTRDRFVQRNIERYGFRTTPNQRAAAKAAHQFRDKNQRREYAKTRKRPNARTPAQKIKASMRRRFYKVIKHQAESSKIVEISGCSLEFLRSYLESLFTKGMSWDNYGVNGWHIDHIIPCSAFDLSNPDHAKRCFHFTNLRPLWAKDNLEKSSKITHPQLSLAI